MKRLSDEVEEWILEALRPYEAEREWTWDASPVLTPNGPGVMLYLSTPGVILGTQAVSVMLVPLPFDKEAIAVTVPEQVKQINEQMAEALQPQMGNGHGLSGEGLIFPPEGS